jgi:putative transposase
LIRILAQRILQELIEAEATVHNGAEPGEHADTRHHCR